MKKKEKLIELFFEILDPSSVVNENSRISISASNNLSALLMLLETSIAKYIESNGDEYDGRYDGLSESIYNDEKLV